MFSPTISNDKIFRFAYASFGDESKAKCTIKKDISVLLYPTTLETKFVPAFFKEEDEQGQGIDPDRSKRQVSFVMKLLASLALVMLCIS